MRNRARRAALVTVAGIALVGGVVLSPPAQADCTRAGESSNFKDDPKTQANEDTDRIVFLTPTQTEVYAQARPGEPAVVVGQESPRGYTEIGADANSGHVKGRTNEGFVDVNVDVGPGGQTACYNGIGIG